MSRVDQHFVESVAYRPRPLCIAHLDFKYLYNNKYNSYNIYPKFNF